MKRTFKTMDSDNGNRVALRFPHATSSAFTLVEVTLALGITAFCLLAIFGLLPIGLKSNRAAMAQTIANGILSDVTSDLRSSGTNSLTEQYSITVPSSPTTGAPAPQTVYFAEDGRKLNSSAGASYLLTISFPPNGTTIPGGTIAAPKIATYASLAVWWPAPPQISGTTYAEGSVTSFVALDRN